MWQDQYARMMKAILQKQQREWDLSRQLAKHIIKLGSRQIDQWTSKSSDIDPPWNLESGEGWKMPDYPVNRLKNTGFQF